MQALRDACIGSDAKDQTDQAMEILGLRLVDVVQTVEK